MPLDPDLIGFLARVPPRTAEDFARMDIVQSRREAVLLLGMLNQDRAAGFAVTTRDMTVSASRRPARLYRPWEASDPLPGLVYFHGGGYVIGDLDTHDVVCRRLSAEAGIAVLAVDYRLAPEHRFPASAEDAIEALKGVLARPGAFGMTPGRIGVGGDSAGATLAIVAAQSIRGGHGPEAAFQLLICPGSDLVGDFPSRETFGSGYFFTMDEMRFYIGLSVPDEADRLDPRASPLRAPDLTRLPPAIIATAGFDPLRDEGTAFADALVRSGGTVRRLHEPDMIHGYVLLDALGPGVDAAVARIGQAVRDLVATL